MCLEFVPAGVSCLWHYDDMLPIGPDNLTHTHSYLVWMKREMSVSLIKGNARMFRRFVGLLTRVVGQRYLSGNSHLNID